MPAFRLKCQNPRCGNEFHRYYSCEDFEKRMSAQNGMRCFGCGFPHMKHMKSGKAVSDGFEPGWQPNVNAWAWSRGAYNKLLREQGLQEIGYDYVPQETQVDYSPLSGAAMAQEIARMDPTMTGQEIAAIESGEYFKTAKADLGEAE